MVASMGEGRRLGEQAARSKRKAGMHVPRAIWPRGRLAGVSSKAGCWCSVTISESLGLGWPAVGIS